MSSSPDVNSPVPDCEAIIVSGALSLKEANQLAKLLIPLRSRMVLYTFVIGVFLAVVGAVRPPFPFGLIFFVLMIVAFFYMWSRIGHRAYRQRRGFYEVHVFEFHERGVRVTANDVETHLKWSAFAKVMSNDRFIVLFVTPPTNYIPLARSWCDTDEEWLRLCDYIRAHSPIV